MLRRLFTRMAPRAKKHEELMKMLREGSQVGKTAASEESGVTFRDVRTVPIGESNEAKRRRLLYQSTYRGMVEMDIILGAFARQNIETLSAPQLEEYDAVLRHFDNDLYKWLVMDVEAPAEVAQIRVFQSLHSFVRDEREKLLKCAS